MTSRVTVYQLILNASLAKPSRYSRGRIANSKPSNWFRFLLTFSTDFTSCLTTTGSDFTGCLTTTGSDCTGVGVTFEADFLGCLTVVDAFLVLLLRGAVAAVGIITKNQRINEGMRNCNFSSVMP